MIQAFETKLQMIRKETKNKYFPNLKKIVDDFNLHEEINEANLAKKN